MIVVVDRTKSKSPFSVADPDDFTRFEVRISHSEDDDDPALVWPQLGRWSDSSRHVFIDPALVSSLVGERSQQPEWCAGFDKMREYAARNGWVDESNGAIRAHVVR